MMACTHPFGVDEIRNSAGELIGVRCPACRMESYRGESFWTALRRTFAHVFGRRAT